MSRFHVLALLVFAVLGGGAAMAADTREVELKKVRADFWHYWAAGDATGMGAILTDDFVQFSQDATYIDKATFLASLKAGEYSKDKIENPTMDDVIDPRTRFYGTVAIVTYSAPLAAEGGSIAPATPRTRITEVWAKSEGRDWKMAHFQVTRPLPSRTTPAAK